MTTPHHDWTLLSGAPIATKIGPFSTAQYLSTVWDHRASWGGANAELRIVGDGGAAAAMQYLDGRLELLGHGDLVDYRSPIADATPIAKELVGAAAGTRFMFDSLPIEAADAVEAAVRNVGIDVARENHTVAAVLELPATYDDYMTAIGKKERHETRRKRRRFDDEVGHARLVTYRNDEAALNRFFNMHRMAPGEKGDFMTPSMAAYFTALASDDRWRVDGLFGDDDRMVAAAFAWSDDEGYYLYNSAFDPSAGHASPGVVLVSMLVEQAIAEGLVVFDFLKGDEIYKFRLGATERNLYRLEGVA